MSAGTITLTNGSAIVGGSGTSFSTELAAGDFIVSTVGGVPYTLPVKTVDSGTQLTLVSNFTGPTQSGAAWSAVPRVAMNMVTAALVAQSAEALRGLNYDKQNWQQIFSGNGNVTVTLPDGTKWTGLAWSSITSSVNDITSSVNDITSSVNDITSSVSGKAEKGTNSDITSLSGLTTALSVAQGGTGSTTASGARTNLELGSSATKNVGSNTGDVVTSGSTQPLYKTTLPAVGYNNLVDYGYTATSTLPPDSVAKTTTTLVKTPGWTLGVSYGIYNSSDNSPSNAAHLLIMTDGGGYIRRYYFYNNGDIVGPSGKFYSEKNTTKAADGTLKAASPVIKLFSDGRAETNAESEGCIVTRLAVGEYLVEGCNGLNSDVAWGGLDGGFDVPTDRNKQPLIWLDYEVNPDGSVLVKTYHRTHPDAPTFARNERDGFTNGDPIDIPSDQFVSVRVEMPDDCIYQQKLAAERQAAYEAWQAMLQQLEEEAHQEEQAREEARQAAEAEQKALEEAFQAELKQRADEPQQGKPEQPDGDA